MATAPEQIIDKNGKQTTVHKSVGKPVPTPRPRATVPIVSAVVDDDARNKNAVREVLLRLRMDDQIVLLGSARAVHKIENGIYKVDNVDDSFAVPDDNSMIVFDKVFVSEQYVSGVISAKGAELRVGDGFSSETDDKGYALPSPEADRRTIETAVQLYGKHLL